MGLGGGTRGGEREREDKVNHRTNGRDCKVMSKGEGEELIGCGQEKVALWLKKIGCGHYAWLKLEKASLMPNIPLPPLSPAKCGNDWNSILN